MALDAEKVRQPWPSILKISALDVGAAIDKMKQSKSAWSNRSGGVCLGLQMKLDVDDSACNAVVKDGEIP